MKYQRPHDSIAQKCRRPLLSCARQRSRDLVSIFVSLTASLGPSVPMAPLGLSISLRKEESGTGNSPTETVLAESPTGAAAPVAEGITPSGTAASGQRARPRPRPPSRPRFSRGKQSHRAAPYSLASTGTA
eukprot:3089452-Pyramimonas_sp.AAC.1